MQLRGATCSDDGGCTPSDRRLLHAQASYLKELNRRGDSESVIRLFEGGQAGSTEASLGEYVKALVAVDRLNTSSLVQTLQVIYHSFSMFSLSASQRLSPDSPDYCYTSGLVICESAGL